MPNHVTNKLIFDSDVFEQLSDLCTNGTLDFRKLIPTPPEMYHGDLSREDEVDFACNWMSWSKVHWGTKCNAYGGTIEVVDGTCVLLFDTAYSVPYPVISALNNVLQKSFIHKYYDEGGNFWGIDTWQFRGPRVIRASTQKNKQDDHAKLCIELKGYDPTAESDEQ